MAEWKQVVTDRAGRTRGLLNDYESIRLTARLNGYAEARVEANPRSPAVAEVAIGERALRLYDGADLRFNGIVWEPLELSRRQAVIVARDPYAVFAWRRAQVEKPYTATNNNGGPWDAGEIAFNRITIQNARGPTLLKAGTRQASVNRERTVGPGAREDEVIQELADADDGFFFKVRPVDEDEAALGVLDILYPDAGTTRPEVWFGYGKNTVANLDDYVVARYLPRNRMVVASSASGGGRLAKSAKDQTSIDRLGLFEDETTFSDVTEETLLAEHAAGELRGTPPLTLTCMPGPSAPLLYRDFAVGDFVRARIQDGAVDVLAWVRVLEATIAITANGVTRLESVTVEVVSGANVAVAPHRAFRARLDDERRRLEALERRLQRLTAADAAAPVEPVDSGAPATSAPAEPSEPTAPPPAPSDPPTVAMTVANGYWIFGSDPRAAVSATVNPNGLATVAWFEIEAGPVSPEQSAGAGTDAVSVSADMGPLDVDTTYRVRVHARNSAGTSTSDWMQFKTPRIAVA